MADWTAFRNPNQSRLLRYEDVIGNFEAVVTEMCWFIREVGPDDDLMRYAKQVFSHETAEGTRKHALQYYLRGWTGRTDIWRSYFSAATVEAYNNVVQKFLNAYPQAGLLATVYPNLTIG
jgi:hypothetical protein